MGKKCIRRRIYYVFLIVCMFGMAMTGCTTIHKKYWEKANGSEGALSCSVNMSRATSGQALTFSVQADYKFEEQHYSQLCHKNVFATPGVLSLADGPASFVVLLPVDAFLEAVNVATMPVFWLGGKPSMSWWLGPNCQPAQKDRTRSRTKNVAGKASFNGDIRVASETDGSIIYEKTKHLEGDEMPLLITSKINGNNKYIWSSKGKVGYSGVKCTVDGSGEVQ